MRILDTIPLLIACEPGVVDKCPYEFRKLIESIFLRFQDFAPKVKEKAEECII